MEMMKAYGVYIVESVYSDGRRVVQEYKNALVQGFFTGIHSFLRQSDATPDVDSLNITRIAFGEGTTAAARTDSLLVDEQYRKAVATRQATNTLFRVTVSLAAGEWNPSGGVITEVGMFAKAIDTANDGLMISRANVSVQKNSNIQLNITWELRMV